MLYHLSTEAWLPGMHFLEYFRPHMQFSLSISPKILIVCWSLIACAPASNHTPSNPPSSPPPAEVTSQTSNEDSSMFVKRTYDFENPDVVFELPKDLKEISGLTLLDEDHLAAIQDEKGKIYKLSIDEGKVVQEMRFAKDGDFEAVELAGPDLYVLRSDGDLYRISDFDAANAGKNLDAKKYNTFLSQKHDTEGLGYDSKNNRLLVACKEDPGSGYKNSRTVYAFDLETRKLQEEPVLVIDLQELEHAAPDHPLNRLMRKLAAPLKDLSGFKPSAIAVHPITGQTFVVSSVRKLLLAYDTRGTLDDLWLLSEDLFRQPEGLAFLPNGDLFMASEGGNGRGKLMRFNYK